MNREVNEDLIQKLKARVRAMSKAAEDEIKDLVLSCRKELELVGIYGDESDPTYYQAVVLYCEGNYGYDEDTDRFRTAFGALRDAMSLSGDYGKEKGE